MPILAKALVGHKENLIRRLCAHAFTMFARAGRRLRPEGFRLFRPGRLGFPSSLAASRSSAELFPHRSIATRPCRATVIRPSANRLDLARTLQIDRADPTRVQRETNGNRAGIQRGRGRCKPEKGESPAWTRRARVSAASAAPLRTRGRGGRVGRPDSYG